MSDAFFRGELATLLEYDEILKKKRSPLLSEEVQKILLEEKNIIARINKIRELDEKNPDDGNEIILTSQDKLIEKVESERTTFKKVSFFHYLFSIRKVLIRMSEDNSILVPKFFGLKFNISDEAITLMEEIRNNALQQHLPTLFKILEKGWQVLDPSLYNLFYYLYQFIGDFARNFFIDKKNIERYYDFLENQCKPLFLLLAQHRYIREIREGIYIFFGNKESDEMLGLLLFIENLLDRKKKFSFINFVVMVYSVHYRTPLSLERLIEIKEVEPVPGTRYLIASKVKPLLGEYLGKIKARQNINEKKLFLLKHIQDENTIIIEKFIQEQINPRFKLELFAADLLNSTKDFVQAFAKYAEPLLISELNFYKPKDMQRGFLFRNVWEEYLNRVKELQNEINYQRDAYKYLFITLDTYEDYMLHHKHVKSEKDEKLCKLVSASSKILLEFFEIMVQLLYNDYKLTYNASREEIFDKLKTRNRPITESSMERFFPFSSYKIKGYGEETVFVVMSQLTALAGTFLYLIQEQKILGKMDEKNILMEESKRNIETIMRLNQL